MKRVLYLDNKSNELQNILGKKKNIIIRGANIKKYPYKMIDDGYTLCLMNNNAKGIVYATAKVKKSIFLELSDKKNRMKVLKEHLKNAMLSKEKEKYILDRKYISIFEITDVKEEYSRVDNRLYGLEDDWVRLVPITESESVL